MAIGRSYAENVTVDRSGIGSVVHMGKELQTGQESGWFIIVQPVTVHIRLVLKSDFRKLIRYHWTDVTTHGVSDLV